MTSRRLLAVLLFSLPPLVVAFAIIMGSHWLFVVSQDAAAATVMRWLGGALLMFIVFDLVLLVSVLAVRQLAVEDRVDEDVET